MSMKNRIFTLLFSLGLAVALAAPAAVLALEAPSQAEIDGTAAEVKEGKEVFEKLQANKVRCEELDNDNFEALGEYFMEQLVGTGAHPSMNQVMAEMHGEEGERQMHIIMGKRLSKCYSEAAYYGKWNGFLPTTNGMMNMFALNGGKESPDAASSFDVNYRNNSFTTIMKMMRELGNNQLGFWGFGPGLIFMVLLWILIIAGIVILIKWLVRKTGRGDDGKSASEILKERYARGEIDEKEFEEKKKNIS